MTTETNCPHALAATVREVAAKGLRGLLVTSTMPGEGKTSLVAGLGRALAVSGPESVLLMDLDSFHPTLHRECGLENGRGLGELLEEVYQFDLVTEDPVQFGIGDWLELLRAQRRTGELNVADGEQGFTLQIVKGSVCSISGPVDADKVRLGEVLLRNGRITSQQKEAALRVQCETGRPFGDILQKLGNIPDVDLADALEEQANQRLLGLIGLRRPECRFLEMAEASLPAAGRLQPEMPEGQRIDRLVNERLLGYLKDPFLSNRVTTYLSDTRLPNLKVLTAGNRACDLLGQRFHGAFRLLLNRLGRIFDIILMDAPSVSMASPTAALSSVADGVLLVLRADGPEVESVRKAIDDLRNAGGNVLGVVLNQTDAKSSRVSPARTGAAIGRRS
jgi:Mrp family chromosome partitioning ATPase